MPWLDPTAVMEATPARRAPTASVLGLGAALPATAIPNDVIAERLGLEDGWIERRTGIASRRRLQPGETLTELAVLAGRRALEEAELPATALDLVVCATTQGDDVLPNLAPLVATALGADRAGAFDLGLACTGFLAALPVAAAQIEAGRATHVLVVGADALSRFTDDDDRTTAALFGDGAGAVVLGADGGGALGPVVLRTDGERADLVGIPSATQRIAMDGPGTFRGAVSCLQEVTLQAVQAAGLELQDIDLFVFHQANRRILKSLAERLGLPEDRVVDAIGELGNTSAASLPLALAHARDQGRLGPGDRVLLGAVGSGFAWGAGVLTW